MGAWACSLGSFLFDFFLVHTYIELACFLVWCICVCAFIYKNFGMKLCSNCDMSVCCSFISILPAISSRLRFSISRISCMDCVRLRFSVLFSCLVACVSVFVVNVPLTVVVMLYALDVGPVEALVWLGVVVVVVVVVDDGCGGGCGGCCCCCCAGLLSFTVVASTVVGGLVFCVFILSCCSFSIRSCLTKTKIKQGQQLSGLSRLHILVPFASFGSFQMLHRHLLWLASLNSCSLLYLYWRQRGRQPYVFLSMPSHSIHYS